MNKFRVYTGPCEVEFFANEWSKVQGVSTFAGTEHVWLKTSLTLDQLTFLPSWARPMQFA